jgi:hypothetical protein
MRSEPKPTMSDLKVPIYNFIVMSTGVGSAVSSSQ